RIKPFPRIGAHWSIVAYSERDSPMPASPWATRIQVHPRSCNPAFESHEDSYLGFYGLYTKAPFPLRSVHGAWEWAPLQQTTQTPYRANCPPHFSPQGLDDPAPTTQCRGVAPGPP